MERLDIRYTPKHGSWLNIAENELSAMTRQCLAQRRIPTIEELDREIRAWAESINLKQKGVRWHMTIDDALGGTVPWPTINAFMVAISLRPTQLGRWSQKIG